MREIRSPFSELWNQDERQILLLVPEPKPDWPQTLLQWLVTERLEIILDPHNGDEMRYALFCPRCGETLYLQIRSVESASLTVDEDGEGRQGKPLVEEGVQELACGCGRTEAYEPPLVINDYQ